MCKIYQKAESVVARYRKGLTQRTQISVNIPSHGLYVIKACVVSEEVGQW